MTKPSSGAPAPASKPADTDSPSEVLANAGAFGVLGVALASGIWALAMLPVVAVMAYVFQCYWNWFVPPTFGVAAIDIVPAAGLAALAVYLQRSPAKTAQKSLGFLDAYVVAVMRAGVFLLIGWILSGLMP